MKNVNFRRIILFVSALILGCTEELSPEQVKEKVCEAQNCGDTQISADSGGDSQQDISQADANAGQTDAEAHDASDTDILTVDTQDGVDTDIGTDAEFTPDVEDELPEPDAPDMQIAETDGEDADTAGDVDVEGETQPDVPEDIPDTATEDVALDAEDTTDSDADDAEDGGEDGDMADLPDAATQEDGEGSDAGPDTPDTTVETDTAPPKCLSNEGCEDGNPCTDNSCNPVTGCVALANQATCTDGSACTDGDICKDMACVPGGKVVCNDNNPCTIDSCDALLGCVYTNAIEPCDDGNPCTEKDVCSAGICKGTLKNCDDGNACTLDSCTGGICSSKSAPVGISCGSNSLCNKQGTCVAIEVPADMVLVPAGEYWRGCNAAVDTECQPDELPYLKVFVSAFLIGKFEVTVKEHMQCASVGKCMAGSIKYACAWGIDQPDMPMNCINWNEAKAYCAWKGRRLPTEAEWQKAARGGCDKYLGKDCQEAMPKFPWGNQAPTCKHAYHSACGGDSPYLDFLKEGMSPYGAYHMAGNVAEWVEDVNVPYTPDQTVDPKGTTTGFEWRMFLGGSIKSSTSDLRVSARNKVENIFSGPHVGLRCAQSITF